MSGAIKLEEIDTEAFTDRFGKLAVNVAKAGYGGSAITVSVARFDEGQVSSNSATSRSSTDPRGLMSWATSR